MYTLFAQSVAGAYFEIGIMLLVAFVIGLITAYLYAKRKWDHSSAEESMKDQIKSARDEINSLKRENNELQPLRDQLSLKTSEVDRLNKELQEARDATSSVEKKYEAEKDLFDKAVHEVEDVKRELHEKEHELEEKDEVLRAIAQKKHLLDYESFGSATADQKDDLKMISGIGPFIEQNLNSLDIFTFEQISKFTDQDIETVTDAIDFFPGRIQRDEWVAQAQELIHSHGKETELLKLLKDRKHMINYSRIGIAHPDEADDLTKISGIGGFIQKKLNALEIYTYEQVSKFTEEDEEAVTKAIEFFPGRIKRDHWVLQARELIHSGGEDTELLDRLKKRKHQINYERIGLAHAEDADDLTEISGVGPFLQQKLNALDIYTFAQVSKMDPEDEELVNEIIEFFPGRIKRDRWVEQAKLLALKKAHPDD